MEWDTSWRRWKTRSGRPPTGGFAACAWTASTFSRACPTAARPRAPAASCRRPSRWSVDRASATSLEGGPPRDPGAGVHLHAPVDRRVLQRRPVRSAGARAPGGKRELPESQRAHARPDRPARRDGLYPRRRIHQRVRTCSTALSDRFVRENDVVLVGVNHRLNMFGYLYLGAFSEKYADSGNVGQLDLVACAPLGARQHLALRRRPGQRHDLRRIRRRRQGQRAARDAVRERAVPPRDRRERLAAERRHPDAATRLRRPPSTSSGLTEQTARPAPHHAAWSSCAPPAAGAAP